MANFYIFALGSSAGRKLSDLNRKFDSSMQRIGREFILADGSTRRDLIALKRTFTLAWGYLPSFSADVYDAGMGVEDLEEIATNSGTLVLRVPNDDGSSTDYPVLVPQDGFKKTLVLRRYSTGKQYWDVELSLEEV